MDFERCVGQRQRDAVVAVQLQVRHFFTEIKSTSTVIFGKLGNK